MNYIIERVIYHNFLSFDDEEFVITDYPGITVIRGINEDIPEAANGAGKSTLFIGVVFALFGKAGLKLNYKNLKNRYVDANEFFVELHIIINGVKFIIIRGATASNAFLKLIRVNPDNDKEEQTDISGPSIAITDEMIAKMLKGITPEIFFKTIFLTPAFGVNFFQQSKTERQEFLNFISGTKHIYDINGAISRDISNTQNDIRLIESSMAIISKTLCELKAQQEAYQEKIKAAKQDYSNTLKELAATISAHKRALKKLEDKANKKETELANNRVALANTNSDYLKATHRLNELNNSLLRIKTTIDKYADLIKKNKSLTEVLCEDCKPKLDTILNTTKNQEQIDLGKKELEELKEQIKEAKKIQEDLVKTKETMEKDRSTLSDDLLKFKQSIADETKSLTVAEVKHTNIKAAVKDLDNTNQFDGMIQGKQDELNEFVEKKTELVKYRKQLDILKFATNDETVKKFVISRFITSLNSYMAILLEQMGADYSCVFNDDYSLSFYTPGGESSYDTFSSGEKMRMTIAASFAFRFLLMNQYNFEVNLLVLDEYFDSNLDKLAINGIISILKNNVGGGAATSITNQIDDEQQNLGQLYNIFIISHRNEILEAEEPDISTLLIKKKNGISKIVRD
jgi:DNA repair exonuclease SbcCD ATPase subunit